MTSTNDEWFVIKDLEGFINSTRALIFNTFGKQQSAIESDPIVLNIDKEDIDELNKVLSFDESFVIIKGYLKKQQNKISKNIRYIINDKIFIEMIESLNDRMVSNMLNSLVNKGLVETAYDSESDDFIFWVKDDVKKQIEKPETDTN
jgi:hypothetical protein